MSNKPSTNSSTKRISVSIPADTESELIAYANAERVSKSWVVKKALIEFLDKNLKQRELPIK